MNEETIRPTKSIFKSQTVWGALLTVAAATAVPGYEAWKETKNVEDILSAVLPVLVATAVPGIVTIDGRRKASAQINFKLK